MTFSGYDRGGTNIISGIANLERGFVLQADSIPINSQDGHDAVMKRMVDLLRSLISGGSLDQS